MRSLYYEKINKVLWFIFVIYIISGVYANAAVIDWCNLKWPPSVVIDGSPENIYGQIYVSGLTDSYMTPAPGIIAEIGYGPYLTDPTNNLKWVWKRAKPNLSWDFGNPNDEYVGALDIPYYGIFSYTYRYSIDGGATWTLGDLDGTQNGIDLNQFGIITVNTPSSSPPRPVTPAVTLLLFD